MLVKYKPSRQLEFTIEGAGQKEIFKGLAEVREVFGESECGNCKETDIYFRVRNVTKGNKTYTYYEMVCNTCYHTLPYGQHQVGGTLFPNRKIGPKGSEKYDNDKKGWRKWDPNADHDEE